MRSVVSLTSCFHRLQLPRVATSAVILRRFAMATAGPHSVGGGNGKTNSWQGLGAAEFDLRSQSAVEIGVKTVANAS